MHQVELQDLPDENDEISLSIRFSNPTINRSIELENIKLGTKVEELSKIVSDKKPELVRGPNNQILHLRFIYRGKYLDQNQTLRFYKVVDGESMHCIMMERSLQSYDETVQQNTDEENEEDEEPRGFDRMRDQGLSNEEIREMRNQFYSSRAHLLDQYENGTLTMNQLHEEEERWMDEENNERSSGNEDSFLYVGEYHGDQFQLFFGILLGFLFGLIMIIALFEKSLASKFKWGLIVGFFVNGLFNLCYYFTGAS